MGSPVSYHISTLSYLVFSEFDPPLVQHGPSHRRRGRARRSRRHRIKYCILKSNQYASPLHLSQPYLTSSPTLDQLVSGSWDRTIKMWDPRRGHPRSLIGTYDAPERVHGLDLVDNTLLVTTSGRRFATYDLRNMGAPLENRTSLLKFNTVRAAMMPSGEGESNEYSRIWCDFDWVWLGFTAGSIEGRVSVEYFDPSPEVQKNKYAFKCHRQPTPKGELVYPINALAFHPKYVPSPSFHFCICRYSHCPGAGTERWSQQVQTEPSPYGTSEPKSESSYTTDSLLLSAQ